MTSKPPSGRSTNSKRPAARSSAPRCPTWRPRRPWRRSRSRSAYPLIADIHFHYQLALECAAGGIDCLRLNPGNLRNEDQVRQVVARGQGARHSHSHRRQLRQPAPGGRHRPDPRVLPPHGPGQPAAQGRRSPSRRLQHCRPHGGHRALGGQPAGRAGLRPDQDLHESL